jgi:hypothetical protein
MSHNTSPHPNPTPTTLFPSALPKEPSQETEDTISAPPSTSFAPFFTLITSTNSTTTHHPTVHYIFSDDDTDVLTDALLHIADRAEAPPPTASKSEAKERYIVVNINESGETVRQAYSLTGDWQVLTAEVGKAPTREGEESGGMMLRVEGTEGVKVEEAGAVGEEGLERLVSVFERRLAEMKRVLEGGVS